MLSLPTILLSLALAQAPPPIDPVEDRPPPPPKPPVSKAGWDVKPPPAAQDDVISGFLKHVATSESFDPKARAFVAQSRQKVTDEQLKDFINSSLAVLSPDFKKALDLANEDQPAKAADLFESLTKSDDPYLAVAAANLAAASLVELDQLDRCRTMLTGVWEARNPVDRYTTAADHFQFTLGYCQVHNMEYEAAEGTLKNFLERFPNAPERLRVTAGQMLTELGRRIPGRLGDVRDLLTYAERKIRIGEPDEPVVRRQKEAVDLMSSLIKEAEEQEQSQKGGGGSGSPGGKQGGKAGGQKPGTGAAQSTLPGGESRVGELSKVRARPGDAWGKMPPRQRDEILQTLQHQFPSQYRELLEQYYKQLAKDASAPR